MRLSIRTAVVLPAVAALLLAASTPAMADTTLSTTGASGRLAVCPDGGDPTWCLYARDTLTDGHCARWQIETSSGWQWWGNSVCTGTEQYVTRLDLGRLRVCRTGIGNCSRAVYTG
jgi:hypothetical protein